jgi:hypothetical protein
LDEVFWHETFVAICRYLLQKIEGPPKQQRLPMKLANAKKCTLDGSILGRMIFPFKQEQKKKE